MNILIRFEDRYGTYELFKRYNTGLLNYDITLDHNISSPQIFNKPIVSITGIQIDYIIIVFDLDPIGSVKDIDGNKLLELLSDWFLDKNNNILHEYDNRVALIPNFFCYESLYLYSDIFKKVIELSSSNNKEVDNRIIALYKGYYDYSKINPESLFNIKNIVENIRSEVSLLKDTGNKWTVQKFHQAYAEQLLRSLFRNVSHSKKYNKIFIKKEDRMFDAIDELEPDYSSKQVIDSIVNGMRKESIHNRRLYKLLSAKTESYIKELITTQNKLNELCKELDEYQLSIDGIKKDIADVIEKIVEADTVHKKIRKSEENR